MKDFYLYMCSITRKERMFSSKEGPSWDLEEIQNIAASFGSRQPSLDLEGHEKVTGSHQSYGLGDDGRFNLLALDKQNDALKTLICSILATKNMTVDHLSEWFQQQKEKCDALKLPEENEARKDDECEDSDEGKDDEGNKDDEEDVEEDDCSDQCASLRRAKIESRERSNTASQCIVRDPSKEYYICHRCATYKTHYKKDMIKHLGRTNKCPNNDNYDADEAYNYSISKRFLLTIPIRNLSLNDYIYITKNYSKSYNVINADYRNDAVDHSALAMQSLVVYKKGNQGNSVKNGHKPKPVSKKDDMFNKMFYDAETNEYVCNMCSKRYKKKQNLNNHLESKTQCERYQKEQEYLKMNAEAVDKIRTQRMAHVAQYNTYITNNTLNNNNNISNTQNNSQSLKVEVRDFLHDRYDVSHINKKYCEENKDFFIYDKFLDIVMMNNHNHNIFFTDDHKFALVYTGKEFIMMKSDKAGYFVLGKLKDCIGEVVCVQKEEIKSKQSKIERYYHLAEKQYKHDTTLKRYNLDTLDFYSDSMCINFRNRDDKLRGIVSKLSKHSRAIRDTLEADGVDLSQVPLFDPNIPFYESSRNRNKELKE